jgi:hypothetical protein
MQLNIVEDISTFTLERPRPMPKWALSSLSNFASFLLKGELGPHWHLPTT